MIEKDVLIAKIDSILRCLQRIEVVTGGNPDTLTDLTIQDAFVLNLQRSVQLVVDMANHLIAENNWRLPDSMKASITVLAENKVISPDLADRLVRMVGFRNIAVHQYEKINVDILRSILRFHLRDIEEFIGIISRKYIS